MLDLPLRSQVVVVSCGILRGVSPSHQYNTAVEVSKAFEAGASPCSKVHILSFPADPQSSNYNGTHSSPMTISEKMLHVEKEGSPRESHGTLELITPFHTFFNNGTLKPLLGGGLKECHGQLQKSMNESHTGRI